MLYIPYDKSIHPIDYLNIKINQSYELLNAITRLNSQIKEVSFMTYLEKEKFNLSIDDLSNNLYLSVEKMLFIASDIKKINL